MDIHEKEEDLIAALNSLLLTENWDELLSIVKPKFFPRDEKGDLVSVSVLARIAATLIEDNPKIPDSVKIVLLKCLLNSCVNGYINKTCAIESKEKYMKDVYVSLSEKNDSTLLKESLHTSYKNDSVSYFPYDGIVNWSIDFVIKNCKNEEIKNGNSLTEIFRFILQFLCNFLTCACKNQMFPQNDDSPKSLENRDLIESLIHLINCEQVAIARAACAYIYNSLNTSKNYFSNDDKIRICLKLLNEATLSLQSAMNILFYLIQEKECLEVVYEQITIEQKLLLLDVIYENVKSIVYSPGLSQGRAAISLSLIAFLSKKFQKRSDLILKTVDSYLNNFEPREVTLLLDIIGILTSDDSNPSKILQKDTSLLINCIYLLKSLHLAGKQSDNYFTPVQKLSELTAAQTLSDDSNSNSEKEDNSSENEVRNSSIHSHPAFGFKAGLIRVIGNMVHKNRENQDLIREEDMISLLLDCCNIDARNPLIIQWTTLAIRNLCENNKENQKVIQECTKVGTVGSAVLREMGVTLHEEDGKKIGIVPLPRKD